LIDEQWQILRKLLPPPTQHGAPRTVYRRTAINAILYVFCSSYAWWLLPRDFPDWKIIYGIFLKWRDDGM
jgi:putative transposase